MELYLLKFSTCLAIFLIFYKLFLEKESIHVFKRYYLLFAILIALSIPLITFTTYVEPVVSEVSTIQAYDNFEVQSEILREPTNYLPIFLWSIYGIGVLLFGMKFVMNLSQILFKIKRNTKQKSLHFIHVLLNDLVTPHTFFSYIFLNKQKFETQQIPREVFWHEETHARQKHSIDILFIELLQIIFWFNPLIYFTKQSIKMNHEFLADQAVLNKGVQPSTYQHILLAFSSNATEPQLANAINYSSIKKRFTVMKTHTSKRKIWLRSLALLPVFALTLYGFSEQTEVVRETHPIKTDISLRTIDSEKKSVRIVEIAGLVVDSETLLPLEKVGIYDLHNNLISSTDKHGYFQVSLETVSEGDIKFEFSLKKNDYTSLIQKEHWGNLSNKVKSVFYFGIKKENSQTIQLSELAANQNNLDYQSLANNFQPIKNRFIFEKKLNHLKKKNQSVYFEIENAHYLADDFGWIKINSKNDPILINDDKIIYAFELNRFVKRNEIRGMTPLENSKALFAIYTTAGKNTKTQQKATPEELAEYNKLAKHYNSQPKENRMVKLKDLKRLEYIYNKMSKEQKATSEPFPDCPPPPPPPAPPVPETQNQSQPKTGFLTANGETIYYVDNDNIITYYNRWGNIVDKNGNKLNGNIQVNASDIIEGQYITKVYKNNEVVVEFKDNLLPPPPPPAPKSPLDHVIEMAKKNALFFYEGKPISSDEAIKLLKSNKELNISTKQSDSKQPKVYISKEPITLDNNKKTGYIENKGLPKPTSSNAVNHLKVMNRHGAKFYVDNNEVTFEKALKAVRKNKNSDISSSTTPPVVKITNKLIGV